MLRSQSQESLTEQLRKLVALANANGLYDAADFIQRTLNDAEVRYRQYQAFKDRERS